METSDVKLSLNSTEHFPKPETKIPFSLSSGESEGLSSLFMNNDAGKRPEEETLTETFEKRPLIEKHETTSTSLQKETASDDVSISTDFKDAPVEHNEKALAQSLRKSNKNLYDEKSSKVTGLQKYAPEPAKNGFETFLQTIPKTNLEHRTSMDEGILFNPILVEEPNPGTTYNHTTSSWIPSPPQRILSRSIIDNHSENKYPYILPSIRALVSPPSMPSLAMPASEFVNDDRLNVGPHSLNRFSTLDGKFGSLGSSSATSLTELLNHGTLNPGRLHPPHTLTMDNKRFETKGEVDQPSLSLSNLQYESEKIHTQKSDGVNMYNSKEMASASSSSSVKNFIPPISQSFISAGCQIFSSSDPLYSSSPSFSLPSPTTTSYPSSLHPTSFQSPNFYYFQYQSDPHLYLSQYRQISPQMAPNRLYSHEKHDMSPSYGFTGDANHAMMLYNNHLNYSNKNSSYHKSSALSNLFIDAPKTKKKQYGKVQHLDKSSEKLEEVNSGDSNGSVQEAKTNVPKAKKEKKAKEVSKKLSKERSIKTKSHQRKQTTLKGAYKYGGSASSSGLEESFTGHDQKTMVDGPGSNKKIKSARGNARGRLPSNEAPSDMLEEKLQPNIIKLKLSFNKALQASSILNSLPKIEPDMAQKKPTTVKNDGKEDRQLPLIKLSRKMIYDQTNSSSFSNELQDNDESFSALSDANDKKKPIKEDSISISSSISKDRAIKRRLKKPSKTEKKLYKNASRNVEPSRASLRVRELVEKQLSTRSDNSDSQPFQDTDNTHSTDTSDRANGNASQPTSDDRASQMAFLINDTSQKTDKRTTSKTIRKKIDLRVKSTSPKKIESSKASDYIEDIEKPHKVKAKREKRMLQESLRNLDVSLNEGIKTRRNGTYSFPLSHPDDLSSSQLVPNHHIALTDLNSTSEDVNAQLIYKATGNVTASKLPMIRERKRVKLGKKEASEQRVIQLESNSKRKKRDVNKIQNDHNEFKTKKSKLAKVKALSETMSTYTTMMKEQNGDMRKATSKILKDNLKENDDALIKDALLINITKTPSGSIQSNNSSKYTTIGQGEKIPSIENHSLTPPSGGSLSTMSSSSPDSPRTSEVETPSTFSSSSAKLKPVTDEPNSFKVEIESALKSSAIPEPILKKIGLSVMYKEPASADESARVISNKKRYLKKSEINSAFTPIVTDSNGETLRKILNQDYCEVCHGVGSFICCDKCPRSFHWGCLDPPLDPDSLLDSMHWFCKSCSYESKSSFFETQSPEATKEMLTDTNDILLSSQKGFIRGIFKRLTKLLERTNPKVFSLPSSIKKYFDGVSWDISTGQYIDLKEYRFPSKTSRCEAFEVPGYNPLPQISHYGIYPIHRLSYYCHACSKSALAGPLLTCDFCPLAWHLDCMDPPLTVPPPLNKKWMCPTHAEYYYESDDERKIRKKKDTMQIVVNDPFLPHHTDMLPLLEPDPNFWNQSTKNIPKPMVLSELRGDDVPSISSSSSFVSLPHHIDKPQGSVLPNDNSKPPRTYNSQYSTLPAPSNKRVGNVTFMIPEHSIKIGFSRKIKQEESELNEKSQWTSFNNLLDMALNISFEEDLRSVHQFNRIHNIKSDSSMVNSTTNDDQ